MTLLYVYSLGSYKRRYAPFTRSFFAPLLEDECFLTECNFCVYRLSAAANSSVVHHCVKSLHMGCLNVVNTRMHAVTDLDDVNNIILLLFHVTHSQPVHCITSASRIQQLTASCYICVLNVLR